MMDISSKGRYAVRTMVFLAEWPGRPLTKTEISEAEGITPGYLQQIMGPLLTAGLVRSFRGKSGGFMLARPADAITVGDVLRATDGRMGPAPCWDAEACDREGYCPTRPFWARVTAMLNEMFDGTTVADLAKETREGVYVDR